MALNISDEYLTLTILSICLILASIASKRLKIPFAISLIVIGMIFSFYIPTVKGNEIINIFSEIGSILLSFIIGMEFSISKIKKLGLNALIVFFFEMGFVFILGYNLGRLLGFSVLSSIMIGMIMSVTSTGLSIKILEDMKMLDRSEVPLLVGVSVLEDIFAMFIIGSISSLAIHNTLSFFDILTSIVKAFLTLSITFLVLTKLLPIVFKRVSLTSAETIFLILALATGLSFLTSQVGVSPSLGAFIAGSLISTLPNGKEIEESIERFALLFISLFFLSIGFLVDISSLIKNFNLILIFSLLALIGKFIGVALGCFFAGYSGLSSVFCATAMMPLGEISLLIAKVSMQTGILPNYFLGVTGIVVLITSLVSYPFIFWHQNVYIFLKRIIPKQLQHFGINLNKRFLSLRKELEPKGYLFNLLLKFFKETLINLSLILFILFCFNLLYFYTSAYYLILLEVFLIAIYFYYLRSKNFKKFLSEIYQYLRYEFGKIKIFVLIAIFPILAFLFSLLFEYFVKHTLYTLFFSFFFFFLFILLIVKLTKSKGKFTYKFKKIV